MHLRQAGLGGWPQVRCLLPPIAALAASLVLSGCTLLVRPEPDDPRNLTCSVEYRPDPEHEGPDLLLMAGASPYHWEEAYMSPLDGLLHFGLAPGRHLTKPLAVRGATCEPPLWGEGHRLPMYANHRHALLCTRDGLEEVVFELETKYGHCRWVIPEGDDTPICWNWVEDRGNLLELSPDVCRCRPKVHYPPFWVPP